MDLSPPCLSCWYPGTVPPEIEKLVDFDFYVDNTNVRVDQPCPAGSRFTQLDHPSGKRVCLGCSDTLASPSGSLSCSSRCPSGMYRDGTTSQACLPCPAGSWGGFYEAFKPEDCVDCKDEQYFDSDNKVKTRPAPPGFYCPAGSASPTRHKCPPGYFCSAGIKNPCPSGTFNAAEKKTSQGDCLPCAPGQFQGNNASQACLRCPAGKYGDQRNATSLLTGCKDCGAGRFGSGEGASEIAQCTDCPFGRYGTILNATRLDDCSICEPGRFGNSSGASDPSGCRICKAGQGYTDQAGQAACKPSFCLAGTYGDESQGTATATGKPNCTKCPQGRFSPATGLTGASQCTPCPPGQWGNETGAKSRSQCSRCPAGRHGDATSASGSVSAAVCKECEPGRFSGSGAASCSLCPEKTFGSTSGLSNASCSGTCPAGWYCPRGTITPKPCSPFTFAADVVTKDTTCSACPAHAHCAGGNSVVNRPGFYPLYDSPDDLALCANSDNHNCFQACLSAEACPGAESMDATALIDNSTVLTISTITKDPAAWLQFYTIAPRGFDWSPRRCGEGYEGALCGNCTTDSNNASWHFVRSSGKCRRCPSPVVAWLASILSFLVLALVAAFLIYRTVNKAVPATTGALDTSNAERKDLLLPIIRQLISFCMLLGKVGSFQVGAVKAFRLASRYVSEATTGIGLGSYWFTCAVGWSFYGRLFVVAALPAVVAVICFLAVRLVLFRTSCRTFLRATITRYGDSENDDDGSVIDDARNHGEEKKGTEEDEEGQTARQPTNSLLLRARCYMDASVVYLFYLAFPTVVQQIFEALACTDITFVNGTSVTYLTADFRVSCSDQAYQAARGLAIALVVTHIILPPVLLAVWIRRNRSELQSAMAIRRMGFLYRGFKLDKYPWWGVVQLVTKVLIAGIVVFLDQELKQMAVAMVLFATLLLMQVALRPFSGTVLNNLQVVALMSLTVTQAVPIVVSSFFVANQQDRMQVINEGVAIAISIALVAFNGLTIILYVVAAWRARGEASEALRLVRAKSIGIGKRCGGACCCCCWANRRRRESVFELVSGSDRGLAETPYVEMDD